MIKLLNSSEFVTWFTNHHLMGEMLGIGAVVFGIGATLTFTYFKYKRRENKSI